jgi:hypothetical protein
MTLKQAIKSNVTIKLGGRIRTSAGWVRSDRVLLEGVEIGCVQTRRSRLRGECVTSESMTMARSGQVGGYDIDWLVGQVRRIGQNRSAA